MWALVSRAGFLVLGKRDQVAHRDCLLWVGWQMVGLLCWRSPCGSPRSRFKKFFFTRWPAGARRPHWVTRKPGPDWAVPKARELPVCRSSY